MPKYYVAIEDFELERKPLLDVITFFFLRENAPFGMEVLDILRQEFGKRKGTYYTILEAIATGHTKLNEIATYAGLNMTSITRYLSDLVDTYEVVERSVPVTEDRKEYFGIIAKMIERKEELRDRGFTVFDLEDFSLSPILS